MTCVHWGVVGDLPRAAPRLGAHGSATGSLFKTKSPLTQSDHPRDVFARLVSPWEALAMRERQGCRSVSIQGDTGDVGERRFCTLRARRVDGCTSRGVVLLALG